MSDGLVLVATNRFTTINSGRHVLDSVNQTNYDLSDNLILTLIMNGGGIGPMKPGNRPNGRNP